MVCLVCCTAARREVEVMLCCSWRRRGVSFDDAGGVGAVSPMRLGVYVRRNTDCILPAWGGCTADTVLSDGMGGMLLAEEVQNSTNKKSALLIVSITASVFFLPCTPCP
jgi:hypothetical protein